jgi:hypothetical protein
MQRRQASPSRQDDHEDEVCTVNVGEVILCDVYGMALLSHSPPMVLGADGFGLESLEMAMLDKPEKTRQLVAALKAALPFEVALTPELIAHLARQQNPAVVKSTETVSDISYAGDEGGIVCHIRPAGADSMLVVSLTHARVARTLPFAAAVIDYQKHRVKKLRKQQGRS